MFNQSFILSNEVGMEEQTQQVVAADPKVEEFKGNKVLILNPGSRFPFSFGLTKARMILEHFDAIKKFVDEYGNKPK